MEVASPRAGHRRSLQGRERGANPSASSKSSLRRTRGGAPAGELLDLNRGNRSPRGRRGGGNGGMLVDHRPGDGAM
eukprot:4995146-Prorocentrum_lima.AAC.1